MCRKLINFTFILMILFAVCSCSSKGKTKEEGKAEAGVGKNEQNIEDEAAADGGSWGKRLLQKPEGAEYVDFVNYLADGTVRISAVDQNYQNAVIWDTKDNGNSWENAGVDMSLSVENGYGYQYSAEGTLYTYNSTILMVSAGEGAEPKTITMNDGESIASAAVSGNTLAVLVNSMDTMQSRIDIYDLQTMECSQLDHPELSEFLTSLYEIGGKLAMDSSGDVLYLAGEEIARYDLRQGNFDHLLEQKELEKLFSPRDEPLSSFAVNSEGNQMVLCVRDLAANSSKLYLCEKGSGKDDEQATVGKLRIYSLKENGVRQAASLFQEMHPEMDVTFEVGYTGTDGVTLSDAIRTLNTELMAGEGPDILLLDGLPADRYIESGILEDVTSMVEPGKDQFFYNIISAYNGGGTIYKVPMTFNIPVILGDAEVTAANSNVELMDILEKKSGNGTSLVPLKNLASAAGSLFITSDILQETLDEKKLEEFYRDVETLFAQSVSDEERSSIDEWNRLTYWADQYPFVNFPPEIELYFGRAQLGVESLCSFEDYMRILTVCKEKGMSYQYLNREKGNHFIAGNVLGMNRTGKNTDAAKQFLEYCLSGEALQAGVYGGFSIIRSNMEDPKYISDSGEWLTSTSNKDTPDEVLNMYAITSAELQELIAFFEKADTPLKDDAVVLQKVMEQADDCLFEGKDPESAAKEVCREVNLYLSE